MALKTLGTAIASVLNEGAVHAKVMRARQVARDWRLGRLSHDFDVAMPTRPARPDQPDLLPPNQMPARRKAGSLAGRIALLHALAHIEFVAIDLAFDLVGRFGAQMPRQFADDWLGVGADEAMHFALLDRRLHTLGSHYGALPAHDGLWEAAEETRHDIAARLAIVPMVLEARGLDVTPATVARLERMDDQASARILKRIYSDEIRHVGAGSRWFAIVCDSRGESVEDLWKTLVKRHFRGGLKPPFNDSARLKAGLPHHLYAKLATA